jgi:hypothetical protein
MRSFSRPMPRLICSTVRLARCGWGGVVRRVANGHLQTSLINDILLTIDTQLHNELISP